MLKLMAFTLTAAFLFAIASVIIGRFTALLCLPLHRRSPLHESVYALRQPQNGEPYDTKQQPASRPA